MAESFERPAARRRPRAAADETSDPMDTEAPAASPALAPPVPVPPTVVPEQADVPESVAALTPAEPGVKRPASVAPRATSGAYVTLNVRVSIEIDQLISRAMAETGTTKRAAVENALRQTYG